MVRSDCSVIFQCFVGSVLVCPSLSICLSFFLSFFLSSLTVCVCPSVFLSIAHTHQPCASFLPPRGDHVPASCQPVLHVTAAGRIFPSMSRALSRPRQLRDGRDPGSATERRKKEGGAATGGRRHGRNKRGMGV